MIVSRSVKNMLWRRGFLHALGLQNLSPVEAQTMYFMIMGGTPPADLATVKANWASYNNQSNTFLASFSSQMSNVQLGKYFMAPSWGWADSGFIADKTGTASWALVWSDFTAYTNQLASSSPIANTVNLALVEISDKSGTAPIRLNTVNLVQNSKFYITDIGFENV